MFSYFSGPFTVADATGRRFLIGVAKANLQGLDEDRYVTYPGLFTRVSNILDWVQLYSSPHLCDFNSSS